MKKIEIEIPEGKKAEWVNGVLTLVEDEPIEYRFKVGDIAILKDDTGFKQGDGVCLISAGAEVEIMSVSDCINDTDKLYEVKYHNATTVVKGGDIIPVEPKPVEFKFKVGDKVRNTIITMLTYTVKERYFINGRISYLLKDESDETILYEEYLELIPQDITERIKTFYDAVEWCSENGHGGLVLEYNVCAFHLGEISTSADILAYLKLRIITTALNEGWEPPLDDDGMRYYPYYREMEVYVSEYKKVRDTISTRLAFKTRVLAEYASKQFRNIYADFCGCKKGGEQ